VISLIRLIFRLLLKPWGLVLFGALIMGVAGMSFALGQIWVPPERAALSQVAGVLEGATKVTSGRLHSVSYSLEIKSADSKVVKVKLLEFEITEAQVKSMLGKPIVALLNGTPDTAQNVASVWELSSGATSIISYEQTRRRHVESNAGVAMASPYAGGVGLLVSMTGFLWLRRRRVPVAA
jgi:hypothetical protein